LKFCETSRLIVLGVARRPGQGVQQQRIGLEASPIGAYPNLSSLRCEVLQGLDIAATSRLDLKNLALPQINLIQSEIP